MKVRVLLADRQGIVLQGIRMLLEREGFDVVGETVDWQEAVRLTEGLRPDVAVVEGQSWTANGLDMATRIARSCPHVKTIILANDPRREEAFLAIQAGVRGYVLTSQRASDLAQAIRAVARGEAYLSPQLRAGDGRPADGDPEKILTVRERQVLQLIAQGHTTKEIAQVLQRSTKTADNHRTRLMVKLGIHQVAGLVRYAIRQGLVRA